MEAKRSSIKSKAVLLAAGVQSRLCATLGRAGEKARAEKGSQTVELAIIVGVLALMALLFSTVLRPAVETLIGNVAGMLNGITTS